MKRRQLNRVKAPWTRARSMLMATLDMIKWGVATNDERKSMVKGGIRRRENAVYQDRAQWRRWYKANKKYQRRLRALRGIKIHPNQASLPRWVVP